MNTAEGDSNDDTLESSKDVSSSVFQPDEDHIESAPNNDSFLGEETIRKKRSYKTFGNIQSSMVKDSWTGRAYRKNYKCK